MKHPSYPTAKNEYLGTSGTTLSQSSKQALTENLKNFAIRLNAIIARQDKEKADRLNQNI